MGDIAMSQGDKPPRKIGYKSPPPEHQFKAGQSGNPAGRKRKPVRALMPRQLRKDMLQIGEMKTRVRTPDGEREVSMYEGVLLRLSHKALNGHGPSMKMFLKLYEGAILAHFEDYKQYFEGVDQLERQRWIRHMTKDEEEQLLRHLDDLRWKTRQL